MERGKLYARIVYAHFAERGKLYVSVCKLEGECVACVYSVYVLWKEENCKCWCVSWNVNVLQLAYICV